MENTRKSRSEAPRMTRIQPAQLYCCPARECSARFYGCNLKAGNVPNHVDRETQPMQHCIGSGKPAIAKLTKEARRSEMGDALALLSAKLPTAIVRYPSGRYGIAGSIPIELTEEYGGMFPGRSSKVWNTEREAMDALIALGCMRFQLADCSWHAARNPMPSDRLKLGSCF